MILIGHDDAATTRAREVERLRRLSIRCCRAACTILDAPTTREGERGIARVGEDVWLDAETAEKWRTLKLISDSPRFIARRRIARAGQFGLVVVEVGHVVDGLSDDEGTLLEASGEVERIGDEPRKRGTRKAGAR